MPSASHNPPKGRESDVVLIASADATAAALLGGLVETLGFAVQFASVDGPPEAEIRRAKPRVYVIDCETTTDCNDEVIGRAIMRGVSVILLGSRALQQRMRELATRHDLEVLFTPVDAGPLGDILDRAARRSR